MFTLECDFIGRKSWITWSKGELTGDPFLVDDIKSEMKDIKIIDDPAYGEVFVTIKDPVAVFLIIKSFVDEVVEFKEGSIPPPPPVPEGAVA